MCLIAFAWDIHPKYQLILAANRDEFYERPTSPADYWQDHPEILGGRDLKACGTWMAVSKYGKMAAVTNFRDPKNIRPDVRSRGEIPTGFLTGEAGGMEFAGHLHEIWNEYNGFNLLALDQQQQLLHYSNYERKINRIGRGIHGISNAYLNTPWPKVERARGRLKEAISSDFGHTDLLEMMGDTEVADEAALPDTGVPKDWEKALSAMCIRTEEYGTCCTTVITITRQGEVTFTEKSYPVGGRKEQTVHFEFQIEEK